MRSILLIYTYTYTLIRIHTHTHTQDVHHVLNPDDSEEAGAWEMAASGNGKVDLVVMNAVYSLMLDECDSLEAAARMLRRGGRVVVSHPLGRENVREWEGGGEGGGKTEAEQGGEREGERENEKAKEKEKEHAREKERETERERIFDCVCVRMFALGSASVSTSTSVSTSEYASACASASASASASVCLSDCVRACTHIHVSQHITAHTYPTSPFSPNSNLHSNIPKHFNKTTTQYRHAENAKVPSSEIEFNKMTTHSPRPHCSHLLQHTLLICRCLRSEISA